MFDPATFDRDREIDDYITIMRNLKLPVMWIAQNDYVIVAAVYPELGVLAKPFLTVLEQRQTSFKIA